MNIGETLTQARQDAGLTVTQVSERTRIRETVVRAIERDDFTLCGGNFYARGHIRSISKVIGIDPEPLVREYDDAHGGAPQAVSAVAAFEPETPVRFRERRTPNWTAAMAIAFGVIVVFLVYQAFSGGGGGSSPSASKTAAPVAEPRANKPTPSTSPSPVAQAPRTDVTIQVQAVQASWINVQDSHGKQLFSGLVHKGDDKAWTAKKKIKILIGNGAGVRLIVNGKDLGSPGTDGQVLRLSFGPDDPQAA